MHDITAAIYSVHNMFRGVYITTVIACRTRGCRNQGKVRHEQYDLYGTMIVRVPELRQYVLGFGSLQILCLLFYLTTRGVEWDRHEMRTKFW